ncbi:phage tail fiber protein [Gluconobacter sphaericus]|uniref:Tail protein n=1 Tax=Gluconobacter sphaericus NBRC 12467 TaxID=1307951 RepID=A0AA37SGR4_9PROT|nr:hypothetical protein [Gluconobacter sphaericus]MBF0885540.1 hypothetical protein [Gluconobacter sphaericus]GBR56503.1 hypothetical protein AA12467_2644 [Gluconobacter sphaericus NBRC 12467]GEB42778.1 hypothetical protein GSP01_15600 [Gluconobacter sphaericus NBRC 12467]GLQ84754.1 hypothetical protein GCM10007872_16620 [Gluconobacter sphaericus NBRC 12467]GLQ85091.1 hypothetical protein GCM10007872_19990 [Gluconobacter sphaericus NBRC 12467]
MADLDITSANSVFVITVTGLLNAPVRLQNYAADRAWDAPELEQAETEMSIDGYLNAGWVPNPVDQTVSLSAASISVPVFENIMAAQQTSRSLYRIGGEITLTSTGRKYTMVNGVLRSVTVLPGAGRTLENRTFAIRWQSVTPAGV